MLIVASTMVMFALTQAGNSDRLARVPLGMHSARSRDDEGDRRWHRRADCEFDACCPSGQRSANPSAHQRQAFRNFKAVLAASGCQVTDVVKTTVFLQSLGDFAKVRLASEQWMRDLYRKAQTGKRRLERA